MSSDGLQPVVSNEVIVAYNRQRRHRPRGLNVTDFTSSEWCQLKVSFSLTKPEQVVTTPCMVAGTARHKQLEEEVSVPVAVTAETAEDYLALKLLNTIAGLHGLMLSGIARELFVFGQYTDTWILGIIDEVRLAWCQQTAGYKVHLSEHKTRGGKSAPKAPQLLTARLQMMLYKHLLDQLHRCTSPSSSKAFMQMQRVDPHKPLSPQVSQLAEDELGMSQDVPAADGTSASHQPSCHCLQDVMQALHVASGMLPPSSSELTVTYEVCVHISSCQRVVVARHAERSCYHSGIPAFTLTL